MIQERPTAGRTVYRATFPNGRIVERASTGQPLYAVARNDGTGRVTFHPTYDAARRAGSRTCMIVKVERV